MDENNGFSFTAPANGEHPKNTVQASEPVLPERVIQQIEKASTAEGQKAYAAAKAAIEKAAQGKNVSEEQLTRAYEAAKAEGRRIYQLAKKTYTERALAAMRRTAEMVATDVQKIDSPEENEAEKAARNDATGDIRAAAARDAINTGPVAQASGHKLGTVSGVTPPKYTTNGGEFMFDIPDTETKIKKTSAENPPKKKKKGRVSLFIPIILLILLFIAGGALVLNYKGVIDLERLAIRFDLMKEPHPAVYTYNATSEPVLLTYLSHPSLKSGDTLALNSDYSVDVEDQYDGFMSLPLVNITGGTLTLNNGTVYLSGGEAVCDMSGYRFSNCRVYINAPNTAITGATVPEEKDVNALTLNGSDVKKTLDAHFVGERYNLTLEINNNTGYTISSDELTLTSEAFLFPEGNNVTVSNVPSDESVTVSVDVIALEAGHHAVFYSGTNGLWGKSQFVDILGANSYYSGDIHTHSDVGKSNRYGSTIEDNVKYAYENGMSFIYSVENSKDDQPLMAEKLSQSDVDSLTGAPGKFLQLLAEEPGETTTHLLVYGTDVWPDTDFEVTPDHQLTIQDAINEVIDAGGLVYIPHFFDIGDIIEQISRAQGMRNINGLELMSYAHEYGSMEVRISLNTWNNLLSYGQHVYGFMATNSAWSKGVGHRYIRGAAKDLSEESILEMLTNGNFYSSNGPELRFNIGDTDMGDNISVSETTSASAYISASHSSPLTTVMLYRYPITGDFTDLDPELVYDKDFTGQNVFSVSEIVPLTLNPREYYRLEVHSEADEGKGFTVNDDVGCAYSNPIWIIKGNSNNYADFDGFTTEANLTSGRSDNGTWYVKGIDRNFNSATLEPVYNGSAIEKQYHTFNSENLADYISYAVYSPDGDVHEYRVYVLG